jgi:hypothetical protein
LILVLAKAAGKQVAARELWSAGRCA